MNRQRTSGGVTFGDVDYPLRAAFGPRVQRDVQLVTVYAGEATVDIDGATVVVPEQHSVLLSPGHLECFTFAEDRPTRHAWCAVAPHLLTPKLEEASGAVQDVLPPSDRVNNLLECGLSLPSGPEADAALESLGLTLLSIVVFEAALGSGGREPRAVTLAKLHIHARLHEPLELSAIARAAHVTPQHLTRLFRQHLGTTPMRYVWQCRTQRGVELLGSTGLAINVIAARTGFRSAFHFSRLIKEHTGRSPRTLRTRLWGGDTSEPEDV
ncbi:MAG: AraC family transcriptional regulator [Dermatophilaceae bacterium]